MRPVIAAGVVVDFRRAAEFAPHDDRHIFIQAPLVQIGDQGGRRTVEQRAVVANRLEILPVVVPAAEVERDDPRAGFDQAAGDEEVLGQLRGAVVAELRIAFAVAFDQGRVFLADIERIGQSATK